MANTFTPRLYLDNNIFIDIENRDYSILDIMDSLNLENGKFMFSSSHFFEALEINHTDPIQRRKWIVKRCKTLEDICKYNYLYTLENGEISWMMQTPFKILDHLEDDKLSETLTPILSFLDKQLRKDFVENCGFDIRTHSNCAARDVFTELDKTLRNTQNQSIDKILTESKKFNDTFEITLSHKYAQYFEILDLMGFAKDKFTSKSNFARFQDSQHAFFASACDVFITSDKRTAAKTSAIFHKEGVKTLVLKINQNN